MVTARRVVKLKREWKLQVAYVSVDKLKEWEQNPRINDEAADKLCAILQEHGFVNPIIATPDGTIRAGHTRWKAAKKLNLERVPVIYVPFESELEAEMFAIADNKSHEWARWNEERLRHLFSRIKVNLSKHQRTTGFTPREIEGVRIGRADFVAQNFAQVVEKFEAEHKNTPARQDYWVWLALPGEEEQNIMSDRFAHPAGKLRQLDTKKMFEALGIKTGLACPVCKGTGDAKELQRALCKRCNGSGLLPLPVTLKKPKIVAKKVVKKVKAAVKVGRFVAKKVGKGKA